MVLTASGRSWAAGAYDWLSKQPGDIGMTIHQAFLDFAAAVNANPGNALVPLSSLRSHDSATGAINRGFLWELGHPVNPTVVSYYNTTLSQGYNATSSSATLRLALKTAFVDDTSNQGYGTTSANLFTSSRGMSHYTFGATGNPVLTTVRGTLLILQDTDPGQEFFSVMLQPYLDGSSLYASAWGLLLFRSNAASGWCVTSYQSDNNPGSYIAGFANLGWVGNTPSQSLLNWSDIASANQLTNEMEILPTTLNWAANGWYDSVRPRQKMPPYFWVGQNGNNDPRLRNRVSDPRGGGTFFQLGSGSSIGNVDFWVRVPSGTDPLPGWTSISAINSWSTVPDSLNLVSLAPSQDLLIPPLTGFDFEKEWPAAVIGISGIKQHPKHAKELEGEIGAGGGDGCLRPSVGVLWPRGTG